MNTNPTESIATVAQVKAEPGSGINTTTDDSIIQLYINGISQYWLQRTGLYSLSTEYTVTENYNGTGTQVLPLREYANSISTLTIGTRIVPASTAVNKAGYFLDDSGRFIYLRGWYCFPHGQQNVQVVMTCGQAGAPADVLQAFIRHVALVYKRKDSINQKTLGLAAGGSTSFLNDIEITPDIERVIRLHSRVGM